MNPTTRSYDGWIGTDAYDSEGNKVGIVRDVFYDDATGKPEWIAVNTGLFGVRSSMVPIAGTQTFGEQGLQLPFTKDQIKDAPNVDTNTPLTDAEEERLYSHYGYDYSQRSAASYGETYATAPRADAGFEAPPLTEVPQAGEIVAEETVINETAVIRETPRTVRLRKYQWTEMVPVQHEEVRMEGDTAGLPPEATAGERVETAEGFTATERPVR